jgi:hypothetical protein
LIGEVGIVIGFGAGIKEDEEDDGEEEDEDDEDEDDDDEEDDDDNDDDDESKAIVVKVGPFNCFSNGIRGVVDNGTTIGDDIDI